MGVRFCDFTRVMFQTEYLNDGTFGFVHVVPTAIERPASMRPGNLLCVGGECMGAGVSPGGFFYHGHVPSRSGLCQYRSAN